MRLEWVVVLMKKMVVVMMSKLIRIEVVHFDVVVADGRRGRQRTRRGRRGRRRAAVGL